MAFKHIQVLAIAVRQYIINAQRPTIVDLDLAQGDDGMLFIDVKVRATFTKFDLEMLASVSSPRSVFGCIHDRVTDALILALPSQRRSDREFCARYGHPKRTRDDLTCYCGTTEGYFVGLGDSSPWPQRES